MSVSALDKDVATRLFKMLAVNEQTAESVKRDHAAYAKLSMLTQQAQMLQAQAINTVNKVAAKADDSVEITSTSTALSTEFDDGAKRLLKMMNVNERAVATIKHDHGACSKLSLLAEQVGFPCCVEQVDLPR